VKDSSKLRDALFTHMDEMSIQMDVLSSLSELKRNITINIKNITEGLEKGRCVNRQVEDMLNSKKQQKLRVA